MNIEIIIILCIAIPCIITAILILMGKADKLIAGYNTASEAEKKEFSVRRLRIISAASTILTAGFISLAIQIHDLLPYSIAGLIITTILTVVLSNTWAKEK